MILASPQAVRKEQAMVVIYYDLETTGLNNFRRQRGVQIVSIGAVTEYGATFHRYIMPTCKISKGATNIHGIYKENGFLMKNGRVLENALDPQSGLICFIDWLALQQRHDNRDDGLAETHTCLVRIQYSIDIF